MPKTKAPPGAIKALRSDLKTLGAKAAAAKWGASESWVRRRAASDARKPMSGRRAANFLQKHFERAKTKQAPTSPPPPAPPQPEPENINGVLIISPELAEHLRKKQPTANRSKQFYNRQDSLNYVEKIIGGSAVVFVFNVGGNFGWRYMVVDEKRPGQVDGWIDKFKGPKG